MRLYLASFCEPENFGPARIIGIVNPKNKPKHIDVHLLYPSLTPNKQLINEYVILCNSQPNKAGKIFELKFKSYLNTFKEKILFECKKTNLTPQQLLPFIDGDTLASWERKNMNNYRHLVADILEELNYNVIRN